MFIQSQLTVYERANQTKMRNMSVSSKLLPLSSPQCSNCGKAHKPPCRAPLKQKEDSSYRLVRSHLTLAKIKTKQELQEYITESKKNIGPCPACNKAHTYERDFPALIGKAQIPI